MPDNKIKFCELFAGIGGFRLGLEKASDRFVCVYANDFDKYAAQIYNKNFGERDRLSYEEEGSRTGDPEGRGSELPNQSSEGFDGGIDTRSILEVPSEEIPEHDLLTAGFPCQAFSIAGKRRGFDDTRGTLFFEVARIAKEHQPMFLLLENVKGLISHDGGKTLEVILETLQELGYYTNYEIHNSKYYGVPQNRERIFFKCTHIKGLGSVGTNKKMTFSERIIQEYLFQLLLNNLGEVRKLQEQGSKDWVVGYLLWKEISQSQKSNEESTSDGIATGMEEKYSQSKEDPWQNIDTWSNNILEENSKDGSKSTTSTAIKQIIESKTYTFTQMQKAILLATVHLRSSSESLWNEVLSSLTMIQENTKYARINNKEKEIVITESGTAHITTNLQNFTTHFIVGHLRGQPRPEVFPIRGSNPRDLEQIVGGGQGNRVYSTRGVSTTLASQAGGRGAKTGLYAYGKSQDQKLNPLDGVSQTLSAGHFNQPKVISHCVRSSGRSSGIDAKQNWDACGIGGKIRRLTPVECERLQSFPDGWTKGISDTQRYKVLGNAVTTNVVTEIGKRLIQ